MEISRRGFEMCKQETGLLVFLGVEEEVVKGARFVDGDKGGKKGFGSVEMAAPENGREKRESQNPI